MTDLGTAPSAGGPPQGGYPPGFMPPFSFGLDDPNYSLDDLVTRQMCAAAHLDGKFANTVGGELLAVPHRAIWPVWDAVDYSILAKHAKWSRERRLVRDVALGLLSLALIGSWLAIGLTAWLSGGLPWKWTLLALLVILIVVFGAATAIVKQYYDESLDIVEAITANPSEANARLAAWGDGLPPKPRPDGPKDMVSSVYRGMAKFNKGIVAVRFFLIDWWKWLRRKDLHVDENPAVLPMTHVDAMYQANVILFNSAFKPFKMAGVTLDDWNLTVDVNRRVNGVDHAATLTAERLHEKLLTDVPKGLLPQLRERSIVVANGKQPTELGLFPAVADRVKEVPDPADSSKKVRVPHPGWYTDHPANRVPEARIKEWLARPPEGARVYAYFQKYAWRGHLVIGTAVNVYRGGDTLNIDVNTHVLPPLADGFNNMFDIPESKSNRRRAMRNTLKVYVPKLLLQSLRANYNNFFTPSGRQTVVRQLHKQMDDELRIDYGSRINLRMEAGDVSKMWRYPYVDDLEFARVIRDKILQVVRLTLDSYGVPLVEFDEQVRILRERKLNYDSKGDV